MIELGQLEAYVLQGDDECVVSAGETSLAFGGEHVRDLR